MIAWEALEALTAWALRCFSEMLCSCNKRDISCKLTIPQEISGCNSLLLTAAYNCLRLLAAAWGLRIFITSQNILTKSDHVQTSQGQALPCSAHLCSLGLEALSLFCYRQRLLLLPLQLLNTCLRRWFESVESCHNVAEPPLPHSSAWGHLR